MSDNTRGTMPLTCDVGMPEAGVCGKPAVVIILFEQEVWHAGDVEESILTASPVCADHAPEEVHEMSLTSNLDEFVVVNLPEVTS